jgi:hypothetical protein
MVSSESRGRSSVAQGLTGLEHEGESCTNRQVEEFRASDRQGAVAKYLSEGERDRVSGKTMQT